MSAAEAPGKRVSWVELYLDLIYALAVAQLAGVIFRGAEENGVWIALGLFVVMWWTWIGFAVLYNREGADAWIDRLVFLVASIPTGVAAIAIDPASEGHSTAFIIALACLRVVLAAAYVLRGGTPAALLQRVPRGYAISAALFAVSLAVPSPWRYVLWAVAILIESSGTLGYDRVSARRMRREHDLSAVAPRDPREALDAHHFAERFGLFLIILLGEVIIAAGESTLDGHLATVGGWAALVAAMILAATLWWLYFSAAVDINLRVLERSGGSPTIARALFAVGHMSPAFALLLTAAGVGLLLEGDPPESAFWFCSIGIGIYLIGTRVYFAASTMPLRLLRTALLTVTFAFAALQEVLSPHAFVWALAAWTLGCAALGTWLTREPEDEALPDYLG